MADKAQFDFRTNDAPDTPALRERAANGDVEAMYRLGTKLFFSD